MIFVGADANGPTLGHKLLMPFYDTVLHVLTRERCWRNALVRQLAPVANERIANVGCGTGALAMMIKRRAPAASVHAMDPDPDILVRAEANAQRRGALVHFSHCPPHRLGQRLAALKPAKIVSSLVFHKVPMEVKRTILAAMHSGLRPHGTLHIADYGWQRTSVMRTTFRLVQTLAGEEGASPTADDCLPGLMREVGFDHVAETAVIPTATGSISIYFARRC